MHQGSSCATSMSGPTRKPSHELIRTQAFRLTELREATNGFKEVNELGRGTYGSVYKAILPDGRKVAVKRANAARRIHCKSRDFGAELEVLCKVRHAQLVNLVGYCEEMGERILVYEFMSNGTLHDHLHGGLTQLSWALRFRIAVHAARGVEYLHRDASPRIIHKDIKSSNILLDGDWNARVADFGLLHSTAQVECHSSLLPFETLVDGGVSLTFTLPIAVSASLPLCIQFVYACDAIKTTLSLQLWASRDAYLPYGIKVFESVQKFSL